MTDSFYRNRSNQVKFIAIAVNSTANSYFETLVTIKDSFEVLSGTKPRSVERNINAGLSRYDKGTIRDIFINRGEWPKSEDEIEDILKESDPLPKQPREQNDEESKFFKEFEEFVSNDFVDSDFNEVPRRYTYVPGPHESDGHYTFYPHKNPTFRVPEKMVQFLKRAYVSKPLGLGWTYERICKYFKINRKQFHFIKTELGWTHDGDEFTREEVLKKSIHQLMDDREQTQRWLLERSYVSQQDAELRKYAALGKNVEIQAELVAEILKDVEPPRFDIQNFSGQYEDPSKVLVNFLMSDIHFGKSQEDEGETIKATNELIQEVAKTYGPEAKVMLTLLGDWFQVDSMNKTTTRGTKVPTISEDTKKTMRPGVKNFFSFLWSLKSIWGSNVGVNIIPGNHDNTAIILMELFIETLAKTAGSKMWLPEWENIIEPDGFNMKAYKHGSKLIVSEHGDGMKGAAERVSLISMNQHRKLWADTDETFIYTGHRHTWRTEVLDRNGIIWFSLPSPSSSTEYEKKNGWSSKRMIHAHVYHETNGLIQIIPKLVSLRP